MSGGVDEVALVVAPRIGSGSRGGKEAGAPFPFYIGLQEAFFLGRRSVGRFNIGQGLFRAFPALQELGNFSA